MTTKKMTKRDYFNILRNAYPTSAADYDSIMAFIDHELELLDRKNSAIRKPTAKQAANESVKALILDHMEVGKRYTITDMLKEFPFEEEFTNQRVSALVRQLLLENKVIREEEKGKAYFSVGD